MYDGLTWSNPRICSMIENSIRRTPVALLERRVTIFERKDPSWVRSASSHPTGVP